MPFSKKTTGRVAIVPEANRQKAVAFATKKPWLLLAVVAVVPLVVLLLFTFKSGYAPAPKKGSKAEKIVVNKTLTELADDATQALQKRDLETFTDIIERQAGGNVNIVNSRGDTLLMVAATLNNVEAVKQLILLGADVNKKNPFTKDTAILRSLYYAKDNEVARWLIDPGGADLNVVNNYNHSPLFLALEKQKGELIDLFLSHGVKEGLSADYLFRASANKNYIGVLAMLKGGINPNVTNDKGNTPLIISASLGDLPSVQALLAYRADINAANAGGNTALIYAARYQHPDVVRELLRPQTMQAPVDVNFQNKNGQTALYWAAYKGNEAIVRRLLAADADPTIATNNGQLPYAVARKNNRTKVLPWFEKDLTEVKNSVIEEDNADEIAKAKAEGRELPSFVEESEITDADIFKAAEKGDLELARRVIDQNKAVVFDKNDAGDTPLLVAVENGHTAMVDLLADNMARIFESSAKGNIFHIAVKTQNMQMLKHVVALARQEGRLAMMLEYKAFPAGSKQPMTPLGFAALDCNKEMYDYLLSQGAKPGVRSTQNNILGYKSPVDLISACKLKTTAAKKLK